MHMPMYMPTCKHTCQDADSLTNAGASSPYT